MDSYLRDDLTSLMQVFEKVAPAAGFPEVYSLMKTHHMDKKITHFARMGLGLLQRIGLTCNDNNKDRRMPPIQYIMSKFYDQLF